MLHKNIHISGKVQGVGFRYTARQVANSMQINGYVRNLSNGNVFLEAEGTEENMGQFLAWCREGPPRARIDHISETEGPVVGYSKFLIR